MSAHKDLTSQNASLTAELTRTKSQDADCRRTLATEQRERARLSDTLGEALAKPLHPRIIALRNVNAPDSQKRCPPSYKEVLVENKLTRDSLRLVLRYRGLFLKADELVPPQGSDRFCAPGITADTSTLQLEAEDYIEEGHFVPMLLQGAAKSFRPAIMVADTRVSVTIDANSSARGGRVLPTVEKLLATLARVEHQARDREALTAKTIDDLSARLRVVEALQRRDAAELDRARSALSKLGTGRVPQKLRDAIANGEIDPADITPELLGWAVGTASSGLRHHDLCHGIADAVVGGSAALASSVLKGAPWEVQVAVFALGWLVGDAVDDFVASIVNDFCPSHGKQGAPTAATEP